MEGKLVCITGASSGIGAACSRYFAARKCSLVLGARRLEKLEAMKQKLLDLGAPMVEVAKLDVTQQESIEAFHHTATAKGIPDILVNNAGLVIGVDHMSQGKVEDWQTIMDTNVMGVLRISRAFLPQMKSHGNGHMILLGSISGHQVYEGGGPYCASKHAIKAIYQTLRLELSGSGIRITSIDPGMVETEFSVVRLGSQEKAKRVYDGMTPLTANDVAECVGFAAARPPHVNIDNMIIMPTDQASVHKVHRQDSLDPI